VKEAFGGSRWKLVELTHVSRYLDYVTEIELLAIVETLKEFQACWGAAYQSLHRP
jgi:hypothetical protein